MPHATNHQLDDDPIGEHREVAPCTVCRHEVRSRVCRGCQGRMETQLLDYAQLYADLDTALIPGSVQGGDKVRTSRTPPTPARLEALSLRGPGGIIGVLHEWEDDWREVLDWETRPPRGRIHYALPGTVKFLVNNLPWACDDYDMIEEFADSLRRLTGECRAALGEKSDYRYIGQCPTTLAAPDGEQGYTCGRDLFASPWVDAIECRGCGVRRSRGYEWLRLGMMLQQDTPDTP